VRFFFYLENEPDEYETSDLIIFLLLVCQIQFNNNQKKRLEGIYGKKNILNFALCLAISLNRDCAWIE
jgi:hypothetical protein